MNCAESAAILIRDPVLLFPIRLSIASSPASPLISVGIHAVEGGSVGAIVFGLLIFVTFHSADLDPCHLRKPVGQNIHQSGARLNAFQLRCRSEDLIAAENASSLLHDRAYFLFLEAERLQCTLHSAQIRFPGGFISAFVRRVHNMQKVSPCDRPGIFLAQIRQHLIDVLAEHRVDREKIYLLRTQVLPLTVEKIRDPLQQHRCLAASRNSVDQKDRNILTADDRVLLLLNSRGDRLHLVCAPAGQRLQKHRILDRDLRIKE